LLQIPERSQGSFITVVTLFQSIKGYLLPVKLAEKAVQNLTERILVIYQLI
jgi:hypothetical protein